MNKEKTTVTITQTHCDGTSQSSSSTVDGIKISDVMRAAHCAAMGQSFAYETVNKAFPLCDE